MKFIRTQSLGRLKDTLLAVLVLVSVVLSYALWSGQWQQPSELTYTDRAALPAARWPDEQQLTAPRWLWVQGGGRTVVLPPGSSLYLQWLQRLAGMEVTNLRLLAVTPPTAGPSVTVQFPLPLTPAQLAAWLPSLSAQAGLHGCQTVTLCPSPDNRRVQLLLAGSGGQVYAADTDWSLPTWKTEVSTALRGPTWVAWTPGQTDSWVPQQGVLMPVYTASWTGKALTPLVHSFFVSPQALTRLDENAYTVLWTDGSRVVWWDKRRDTLTFADPNTLAHPSGQADDVTTIVQFLRNHGGTPQQVCLTSVEQDARGYNWTLTPLADGFPVYSTDALYRVETQGGRVTQFRCPLSDLGSLQVTGSEQVLGSEALRAAVQAAFPGQSLRNLHVELGYAVVHSPSQSTPQLRPAYFIFNNGVLAGALDGHTGARLAGEMDA
ncbi:MAG: hypothetical protein K6T26_01215 [Alicyclobacillus sp.]|nr:hypothetical protein [Alicyclobacillus sp.]